jgi:hypothetical protein
MPAQILQARQLRPGSCLRPKPSRSGNAATRHSKHRGRLCLRLWAHAQCRDPIACSGEISISVGPTEISAITAPDEVTLPERPCLVPEQVLIDPEMRTFRARQSPHFVSSSCFS